MDRRFLIPLILLIGVVAVSKAITCYVCVATSCGDPFSYTSDTYSLYKYSYNSSYVACGKVVLTGGSIIRGGLTTFSGFTYQSTIGTFYACTSDLCNEAARLSMGSQLVLLFGCLISSLLIKKHFIS